MTTVWCRLAAGALVLAAADGAAAQSGLRGLPELQTVFVSTETAKGEQQEFQRLFTTYLEVALQGKLRDLEVGNYSLRSVLSEAGVTVVWNGTLTWLVGPTAERGDAKQSTPLARSQSLGPVVVMREKNFELAGIDFAAAQVASVLRALQRPSAGRIEIGCGKPPATEASAPAGALSEGLAFAIARQLRADATLDIVLYNRTCDSDLGPDDRRLDVVVDAAESEVQVAPVLDAAGRREPLAPLSIPIKAYPEAVDDLGRFYAGFLASSADPQHVEAFRALPPRGAPEYPLALASAFAKAGYPRAAAAIANDPALDAAAIEPRRAAELAALRGELAFAASEFARAVELIELARNLSPEKAADLSLADRLADAAVLVPDPAKAVAYSREALALSPTTKARIRLANALVVQAWTSLPAQAAAEAPQSLAATLSPPFVTATRLLRQVWAGPDGAANAQAIDIAAIRIARFVLVATGSSGDPKLSRQNLAALRIAERALALVSDESELDRQLMRGRVHAAKASARVLRRGLNWRGAARAAARFFDAARQTRDLHAFGRVAGDRPSASLCATPPSNGTVTLLRYPQIEFERAEAYAMAQDFAAAAASAREGAALMDCEIVKMTYEATDFDVVVGLYNSFVPPDDQVMSAPLLDSVLLRIAERRAKATPPEVPGPPRLRWKDGSSESGWDFATLLPFVCRYPEPVRTVAAASHERIYNELLGMLVPEPPCGAVGRPPLAFPSDQPPAASSSRAACVDCSRDRV